VGAGALAIIAAFAVLLITFERYREPVVALESRIGGLG